jgi:glucose 1-dehydrogenase
MADGPLTGSVAVVTGAGGGIGGACARALAARGAAVGLIDVDPERARAVATECEALGARTLAVPADVARPDALVAALAAVRRDLGEVEIAVSAVAHEEHGGLLEVEPGALRRSLEVTVVGCFSLCRLVAEDMVRAGRGGRIVVIGSLHATLPLPGAIAYNAAEAALRQLARSMAAELAPHRIGVNLVEPGWIDTPGERRWYSEEELARAGAAIPFGRLGTPEDVARAVEFLATPGTYVTGATVRVDGGLSLGMARLPGGPA